MFWKPFFRVIQIRTTLKSNVNLVPFVLKQPNWKYGSFCLERIKIRNIDTSKIVFVFLRMYLKSALTRRTSQISEYLYLAMLHIIINTILYHVYCLHQKIRGNNSYVILTKTIDRCRGNWSQC